MDRKEHWETVYETKQPADVSWFQPLPERSLALIAATGAGPTSAIIDIGGGDATLVDALLDRGHERITVLDLSGAALTRARKRLGTRASSVSWIEADITQAVLPANAFDVWHDRAVFHFLTEAEDRARYVTRAAASVHSGGALIVGTFALDGPTRCSGLEVARYSPDLLAAQFALDFALDDTVADVHETPWGAEQHFTFAVFRRR